MLNRFLLLFPQYRKLHASATNISERYVELHADKLRIQDQNVYLSAELERLRQDRDRWIKEALECNKMLANVGWQGRNSWVPWPDSGRLPDEYMADEKPGPVSTGHVRANDEAASQSAKVLEEYFAKVKKRQMGQG